MVDEKVYLCVEGRVCDAGSEEDMITKAHFMDAPFVILEEIKDGQMVSLARQSAVVVGDGDEQKLKVPRPDSLTDDDREVLLHMGLPTY